MKRSFFYLLVLTALAVLAALLLSRDEPSSGDTTGSALFMQDMAGQINDVDRVEVVTAGKQPVVTLIRAEEKWQVEQMSGYQADWPKLQKLLSALATAKIIETKTDKPEYYSRLGVEGVDSTDAASVLVRLFADDQAVSIIVGNRAQGRSGQYVRLEGEAASALVDQNLDVPTETHEWANKRIIDINSSEVAEVEIVHPDGERVLVTKISADQTDFELVGKPPEREIKSSWAVNSLGSVLSLLDLETVRTAGDMDWSNAVRMRVLLFSGVEIMADMMEADGEKLVRLRASHPAAKVTTNQGDEETVTRAAEDVATTVTNINQRVTGWVYGITGYKYDAMIKKPEDLLKPVESP